MAEFKAIVPVLKVADMQRAVAFYTGVLGFTVCWQEADHGDGENCMLSTGATNLLLSTGSHLGDKPLFTGTLYVHMNGVRDFFEKVRLKAQVAGDDGLRPDGIRYSGLRRLHSCVCRSPGRKVAPLVSLEVGDGCRVSKDDSNTSHLRRGEGEGVLRRLPRLQPLRGKHPGKRSPARTTSTCGQGSRRRSTKRNACRSSTRSAIASGSTKT